MNIADGLMLTAFPLLAAGLSERPTEVAGVTVALHLPWLLFGLVSGFLLDRYDRRLLLAAANTIRAAALGALAAVLALGAETLVVLYSAAFAYGICQTLVDTGVQALTPRIVAAPRLEAANGRLMAIEMVLNRLAGPAVGGVIFAAWAGLPVTIGAGALALAALLIFSLGARAGAVPDERRTEGLWRDILEGLRFLVAHRLLRALTMTVAGVNLLFSAGQAVLVLLATERLGLGSSGFGLLLAAGAVGGFLGSLAAGTLKARLSGGMILCGALVVTGAATAVMALTKSPVVVGAALAASAFTGVVWNVINVSLRQRIVPDVLLGRVSSAMRLLAWGAIPVGAALGGLLTEWGDLVVTYLAIGSGYFLMVPAVARFLSNLDLDNPDGAR